LLAITPVNNWSSVGVAFAAMTTFWVVGVVCSGTVLVKVRSLLSPSPLPALALAVTVRLPLNFVYASVILVTPFALASSRPESGESLQLPSCPLVAVAVFSSVSLTG